MSTPESIQEASQGALILPLRHSVPSPAWLDEVLSVCDVILVDDGMPAEKGAALAELARPGVTLLRHALPLGHGRAVKTGLHALLAAFPSGAPAVIALADTYSPGADIAALLSAAEESPGALVVGIPPVKEKLSRKTRLMNWLASTLFSLVQGKRPAEVRAPLRALPGGLIAPAAVLKGEGDDYILNLLLVLCKREIPVRETEVTASHDLPPIPGSMWAGLIVTVAAFLFSSLFSAMLDYILFVILYSVVFPETDLIPASMELLAAQVSARVVSSTVNFLLNKKLVFRPAEKGRLAFLKMLGKYYLLVIISLGGSSALLYLFSHFLGMPAPLAKPFVELIMYALNYFVQRDIVFRSGSVSASDE